MKNVKSVMVYALASLACVSFSKADETTVIAATPAVACHSRDKFALDFSAEANYFSFDEGILVLTPEVSFELLSGLDISAALPVYNTNSTTGLGDFNVGADYTLFNSKCGFIGADKASFGVNGVVGVPLDGTYSSENTNFTVGAEFGLAWGKFDFEQTFSYLFENGDVYTPTLGGFVDGSVFSADSTLSYAFTESLSVGVVVAQTYLDGGTEFVTVGPCASYKVNHNVDFTFAMGFPITQEDMPYGEVDYTLTAGLGFSF